MKNTRKKVFNISVFKITQTLPNGEVITYNDIKTNPDLGVLIWDFLGHHFIDKINNIVEYIEYLEKKK